MLAELKEEGVEAGRISVDPTRGTKMMSAALTLAAVRRDVPNVRYIVGERDHRGAVTPGSERIVRFKTTRIMASHRLEDAQRLFRHGNFAAVLDLLPDPGQPLTAYYWPVEFHGTMSAIRALAEFYGAWDRLNHRTAHAVGLPELDALNGEWHAFYPNEKVREWVELLARSFPDGDDIATRRERKAPHLCRLMVDIWANGLRRINQGQLEDAAVRAYRVLEMTGQMLLFRHGHDSACLNPEDPAIRRYVEQQAKSGNTPMSKNKDGTLMAPRERVTGILKHLGDPMAKALIDLGDSSLMSSRVRNSSVLIHGFQAMAPDIGTMREFYRQLREKIVLPGCESNGEAWLTIAQTPNFEA